MDRSSNSILPLNNVKNFLLMLIVCFGTFYTLTLNPPPGFVLDIKRIIVVLFISLELIHILSRSINKSIFYIILLANILYFAFLLFINSNFYDVLYYWLSILFIFSVYSHFYRVTQKDMNFFLKIIRHSISVVISFFLILLILYFLFDIEHIRLLIVFGFGNDYSPFAVWAAYLSLFITYLELRFNIIGRSTIFYQAILLIIAGVAGGRTGSIMILCSISIYLFFTYRNSIKLLKFKILLLIVSILFIGFYFAGEAELLRRFVDLRGGSDTFIVLDIILSRRLTMIVEALDLYFKQSNFLEMLFGHGLSKVYIEIDYTPYKIHNFMIRYLLEVGLFGLISFMTIYVYPFFARYPNGYKSLTIMIYLTATINALLAPSAFFSSINICGALWVIIAMSTQLGKNKNYFDSKLYITESN